jgi:hypothetical protein
MEVKNQLRAFAPSALEQKPQGGPHRCSGEDKISCLCHESNSDSLAVQHVTCPYTEDMKVLNKRVIYCSLPLPHFVLFITASNEFPSIQFSSFQFKSANCRYSNGTCSRDY